MNTVFVVAILSVILSAILSVNVVVMVVIVMVVMIVIVMIVNAIVQHPTVLFLFHSLSLGLSLFVEADLCKAIRESAIGMSLYFCRNEKVLSLLFERNIDLAFVDRFDCANACVELSSGNPNRGLNKEEVVCCKRN